jgi:hypothetical protein
MANIIQDVAGVDFMTEKILLRKCSLPGRMF